MPDSTSSSSGSDSWPSKYGTVVLGPLGGSENTFIGIVILAASLRAFVRVPRTVASRAQEVVALLVEPAAVAVPSG